MSKNKNKRKRSITTKNTQRKVNTNRNNSEHYEEINVDDFINNIDDLLECDETSNVEKLEIIQSYIFIHEMYNKDVPERINIKQYEFFKKGLVDIYNTDKERFFNAFNQMIEDEVNQSDNILDEIKAQLSKDDAEQLELLIDSKIYRI